jgi:hypothetical protein
LAVCGLGWRFFLKTIPVWLVLISDPIFQASQRYPALGRFVHVLVNAVPDIAFALLAVAGLAYLVPETVRRLEAKRGVRLFLITFFTLFGLFAIIVNAVNREEQEHKESAASERMGVVMKSVTNIQEALQPKSPNMTELERREHLMSALRDEYILSHDPIDSEILAGVKMPPEEWMNDRLRKLKEPWAFKDAPKPTAPQIVQQAVPEEKRARLVFSFFQQDMSDAPQTIKLDPMNESKVSVSIVAMVVGDVPAENLQIWIRRCEKCEWVPPSPPGFASTDPDHEFDMATAMPELLPNISTQKWNFTIRVQRFPKFDSFAIGCYYACRNCAPVDWKRPQTLWVTQTLQSGVRLQFSPVLFSPEKVRR